MTNPLKPDRQVLCIGNCCYDIIVPMEGFPLEDVKYTIRETLTSGGGPAANAAYLLSLWGADCWFAGAAGRDAWGEALLREFGNAKVNISLMDFRDDEPTPMSVILVNTLTGGRTILHRKTKAAPLTFPDRPPTSLKPGLILADGHELGAVLAAMEAFPSAAVILDAGSVREGTLALARHADYLITSQRFAEEYCAGGSLIPVPSAGIPIEETAKGWVEKLSADFSGRVAVTLGGRGLVYRDDKGGIDAMGAYEVPAVDSTAAGDIFHGAFAWTMLNGRTWKQGLELASAAAALSVTRKGGRQSIPSLEQTLSFMETRKST